MCRNVWVHGIRCGSSLCNEAARHTLFPATEHTKQKFHQKVTSGHQQLLQPWAEQTLIRLWRRAAVDPASGSGCAVAPPALLSQGGRDGRPAPRLSAGGRRPSVMYRAGWGVPEALIVGPTPPNPATLSWPNSHLSFFVSVCVCVHTDS